jgi:RNA polymerase sigma-70 factor (ECF subfamily)
LETATTMPQTAELERDARFAAFVEAHRAQAVSTAWRLMGGDAAAAEDVAQDAFIAAHRALPSFRGDAKLSTWFYRILVRQAARQRRKQAVRSKVAWLWGQDADAHTETIHGDHSLQKRIARALDGLSAGQRETFVLVHLEGLTITETADVLGRAPGTIKSHLHRALVRLRAELGDLHEGRIS